MRIEYKILWVEDEKSWYDTTKELFTDTLEDLGFKLISHKCENIDQVKAEVKKNNLADYDLLLVDYTLKNSDSGDKIIEFIRNIKDNPILTDVLFYSSAVENVRDSMRSLGLEGVYTADRKEIETKFDQVVNTTIKKIQEVNTMRGLIMAETSDLDVLMVEIIELILTSEFSEVIEEYITEKIKETVDKTISLASNKNTIEKIHDSRIFTTLGKAKAINKISNLKHIGIKNYFDQYNSEIISTRNLFAHVKEVFKDGERVLISELTGHKELFNGDRCIEIRKNLIKYRDILENIKSTLESQTIENN